MEKNVDKRRWKILVDGSAVAGYGEIATGPKGTGEEGREKREERREAVRLRRILIPPAGGDEGFAESFMKAPYQGSPWGELSPSPQTG